MRATTAVISDRILLSLAEPSTLTIIVPKSQSAYVKEMRTGKRVKIQFRDPRDFGEPVSNLAKPLQLDIVFEDGTPSPWAVNCSLSDFKEYVPDEPFSCLPMGGQLKVVVVRCDDRNVLTLPAFTDITLTNGVIRSNSLEVSLISYPVPKPR